MSLILLWALVGLAIDRARPLQFQLPPLTAPPLRRPEPRLIPTIISVVGGVIGGWVFAAVFGPGPQPWIAAGPHPEPWLPAIRAASTAVGAFVGARLLVDVYDLLRGRGQAANG